MRSNHEWLRHRARLQLQQVVEGTTLDTDPADLSTEIRRTIAELEAAVQQIERGKPKTIRHNGD